jgi:Flp pilus assembly protein TadG
MAIKKLLLGKSPGSLIPLSFGFFLIAICLAFISINISTAYALKKELTNIGEAAINKAAHSLNLFAYYGEINRYQSNKRVPLDCQLANTSFSKLVQSIDLSGKKITVERFTCDLYELSAQISVTGRMPIQIPFFNLDNLDNLTIRTNIGASSRIQP